MKLVRFDGGAVVRHGREVAVWKLPGDVAALRQRVREIIAGGPPMAPTRAPLSLAIDFAENGVVTREEGAEIVIKPDGRRAGRKRIVTKTWRPDEYDELEDYVVTLLA